MVRRGISTLIAALMTVSLLAGCGSQAASDQKDVSTASASTTKVEESTATVPEPAELTLWRPSRSADYELKANDEFMKKYPHIKLNVVTHEGDPGNDYFAAFAAGNAPDVVYVSWAVIPRYMSAGILLDITDKFNAWEDKDKFAKQFVDRGVLNGKVFGVPTGKAIPMLLGYNKKLFAEAGLTEAPKTWEELLDYAKKLTKPEKQQYGYGMLSSQWQEWWFQFYVWQAGGDLTKRNDDGTIALTFTDPAVIKAAQFYQQLRKEKVTQNDITMKFEDLFKNFAAGKCGMMIMGGDSVGWLASMGLKTEELGLAPMPAGPAGQGTASMSGQHIVINPSIEENKQAAAWEYIKFLASKDYLEGELKEMVANGAIDTYVIARNDVDITDFMKIDAAWAKAAADASTIARDEFYGKAVFGTYIEKALEKVIAIPTADPAKEFQAAQDLATKEALDKFNVDNKVK